MLTPMKDVEGNVAFVTGGASGIGFGIVSAALAAGMRIAIGDSNRQHLDNAVECLGDVTGRVHPILVDITNRREMEQAAAEVIEVFGKLHVLVNNAGVQSPSTLSNMSYDEWDRLMGVNLGGIFNGIHAFLPRIKQHGEGGHVVTTASVFGLFTSGGAYAGYCASKFAAVAMMESLRAELSESNIGVSVVCPGLVKSNLGHSMNDSKLATDPLEIGRLILRGMQKNDLYILTHPEFNSIIRRRNDAIMAATPSDMRPSDERITVVRSLLQSCIYVR
jgi:NAD(P)-dependent dehydrogenase (short-subunit alcohol dehydrogenase family)